MRKLQVFARRVRWPSAFVVAFVVVLALSIAVTAWGSAPAPQIGDGELRLPRPVVGTAPARLIADRAEITGGSQFYSDLTVVSGQTIEDDVVVLSGNVLIEPEGRIEGNLVVYSGNVDVREDAEVEGDLTAFSGNIAIAGTVEGNVSSWSGNVLLLPTAEVEGDVSAVSGTIQRERGAEVGGNVVSGPRFGAPGTPGRPFPFGGEVIANRNGAVSAVEWLWRFILRLIGAGVITALLAGLAWLLTTMRPRVVSTVEATIRRETALSFVVGIVVNLALVFVTGIFTFTICLVPLALLSMLAILALNLAGWTALGNLVSESVGKRMNWNLSPAWASALGVAVITAIASLLWAFGGCFRFVGFVAMLIVASVGTGAFLLPWIRRHNIGGAAFAPTETPPDTPPNDEGSSAVEPVETPTERAETPQADTGPRSSDVDVYAAQTTEGDDTPDTTTVPLAAEELDEGEPPTSAPIVPVEDTPTAETSIVPVEDDFTQLYGVGPTTDRKLKDANVRTFVDLASLTVNEVAEIVGFPPERITRIELIEQARAKVEGK